MAAEENDTHSSSPNRSARSEKAASAERHYYTVATSNHCQESVKSLSRSPNRGEIQNLPHVRTSIPITTWLLVFTGSAAAFARYGVTTPVQNYIQNPPGNSQLPGALGLGQAKATTITSVFSAFIFLTPLPMGILSDAWLGRYKTMIVSIVLLLSGYTLLVVTAIPASFRHGASLGGLLASLVLIGLGQGGLSAIMFVFIGDQIPESELEVRTSSNGKLEIVDRKITIQIVFNTYFWASNLASLSIIGTTMMKGSAFGPLI